MKLENYYDAGEVYEEFELFDPVVAELGRKGGLGDPCDVRVWLEDDTITVHIGPRSITWERGTGVIINIDVGPDIP